MNIGREPVPRDLLALPTRQQRMRAGPWTLHAAGSIGSFSMLTEELLAGQFSFRPTNQRQDGRRLTALTHEQRENDAMRALLLPIVLAAGIGLVPATLPAADAGNHVSRNQPVLIQMALPANAEVWFDGDRTSQSGTFRQYLSPAIPEGRNY